MNLSDTDRHRFDFRVGLRSNLKLRTACVIALRMHLGDSMLQRLSETVYFIDGTGFGSFTHIRSTVNSLTSLVRWSTEFRAQEDFDTSNGAPR